MNVSSFDPRRITDEVEQSEFIVVEQHGSSEREVLLTDTSLAEAVRFVRERNIISGYLGILFAQPDNVLSLIVLERWEHGLQLE